MPLKSMRAGAGLISFCLMLIVVIKISNYTRKIYAFYTIKKNSANVLYRQFLEFVRFSLNSLFAEKLSFSFAQGKLICLILSAVFLLNCFRRRNSLITLTN